MQISLGVLLLVFVVVASGIAYLLSEAGLPFLIARVVAQSGGRLTVEGASGSIGSTMRFRRLVWNGADARVEADDVALDWNPGALTSWRLSIRGLGAQRLVIAVKASSGPTSPPENLTLPLDVTIGQLAVAELKWQAGPQAGAITGLEFSYAGNADRHAFTHLKLITDLGALDGNATVNAHAPLDVAGTFTIDGDGPLLGARVDARLGGTLAATALDGTGQWHGATLKAKVQLAPFAGNAFEKLALDLDALDLKRIDPAWPHARIAAKVNAAREHDDLAGTFEVSNSEAGTMDAGRVPVGTAEGSFSYRRDVLKLERVAMRVSGGGRVEGNGDIDLAHPNAPGRFEAAVRDVDLKRLNSTLITTQLTGKLSGAVDAKGQRLRGDLSDKALAVAFEAAIGEHVVEVSSFRVRAGGGSAEGSGRLSLEAAREFSLNASVAHFDPSRFGAFPAGVLDGTLAAKGNLQPAWSVIADLLVRKGSKLQAVAVDGTAHARVQAGHVTEVALAADIGSAQIKANGAAGSVGDRLAFSINAPQLSDFASLLPPSAPKPIGGSLRASGDLRVEPGGMGGDIALLADRVSIGRIYASRTLEIKAAFAPGGASAHAIALDQRPLSLNAVATDIRIEQRALARVSVTSTGSFGQHTLSFSARGQDIDASAAFTGTLSDAERGALQWKGEVAALENRGPLKILLTAPATLEIAAERQRLAGANLAFANGRADIDEILRDHGRITSNGVFAGLSVANIAKLLGEPLPLRSTLTLAGDWKIAATPRLNGSFTIAREGGDLFGQDALDDTVSGLAFGITTLTVSGTLADDTLDARAELRTTRVGNATATLKLGSASDAVQGHLARDAPLDFTVDAELASLQPLQPWIGTSAVIDGRASAKLTARGTLGAPELAGTISADRMRIDAPEFGVSVSDGVIRAHLVDRSIVLDELQFTGGDGRFVASGTIARGATTDAGGPATRIAWRTEKFRVVNRPDLRFVVGGSGTLAVAQKKLSLAGSVNVEEGHVEYEPSPPGKLGPDVVVKGWPKPDDNASDLRDLPLTLDVDVDLGSNLTFVGEGLEARLAGRVKVTTQPSGVLFGHGTIRAVNGSYYAFGQKLTIDRGRLIFDGPLANPALDIVALRKNLPVEAGVKVSGTVKVPTVAITSDPPVTQNEALSWLVTGQGLSSTGSANYGALSAASAALLARGGKPVTTQIAQSIGLDDISVQGTGSTATSSTQSQVVFFGKRLTDRLTLGYEQGLSLAGGALRLDYALNRALTLRAEAGPVSGVGVYYRRSFR